MPVIFEISAKEWDSINQMKKDYKVLYEALEEILKMVGYSYDPRDMQLIAGYALSRVTIKP